MATPYLSEARDFSRVRFHNIISDVVNQLPKNISKKEAVNYFCRWIKDNIDYNYDILSMDIEPMYDHMMELVTYSNSAYEQCVIEGEAICSRFSIILSKLCNKVGIDSYVAFGTVTVEGRTIGHAWVAVEIAGNTYYVDQTYVYETGNIFGFNLKNEMIRGISGRVYSFDELFNSF